MIDVSEEIKDLYRCAANSKSLNINFAGMNLSIGNEKIFYESMGITESICENEELTFGDCNAAEFKITVADIPQDLNGETFTVTQILDNNPDMVMPLGTYTVKSCKRQSDRRFKDIIAYDDMVKLDRDVTAWYNSRPWPVKLKSLRESLLVYCGIAYEPQDLPNDDVLINKTIRPSSMNGRDVMKRICELNGGFGHITRQNKFKVITLAGLGLYPSETLYPSEDLFPAESGEIIDGSSSGATYRPESTYEDYICRAIDQLRIRTGEDDTGVVVNNGTAGTNEYIVQGNFLISDKSTAELTQIAEALFLVIKNKYYRPHNMVITGLPYLEVGDSILINTRDDVIESFIFSRTLTGIQALKDSLSATGYEYRQNKVGLDVQISQLEQTTSVIQEDIEEIEEFNGETLVSLKKLEDGIAAEVSRATEAEGQLSAQINITAEEVSSKVTKGDVVSEINQSAEAIVLMANRLIVKSNDFSLDGDGNAEFSGVIKGGYLYIKDQYDNVAKIALQANQNVLWIGEGFTGGVVIECGSNGLTISGDGGLGCKKINTGAITCSSINAGSHTHSTGSLNASLGASATYAGTYYVDFSNTSGDTNIPTIGWVKARQDSDVRLKDILEFGDNEAAYLNIEPIAYRFKDGVNNKTVHFGFKAQDLAEMFCGEYDLVEFDKDMTEGERKYCNDGVYRINYDNLHALHVQMIQKLSKRVSALENELADLKSLLVEKGVI